MFMLPTYFWRLAFIAASFERAADVESIKWITDGLMVLTYLILVYIAYQRGQTLKKPYLVIFPLTAALFDLVIVYVLMYDVCMLL